MKTMTIRNVPDEVAQALDAERLRRGLSLNRTVLALIAESLGVSGEPRSNGLKGLSGDWTEDEYRQFEAATARFSEIDDDLWR